IRIDFSCQGNARTWVLSPGLRPIAELDTPQLPTEITTVRSDFSGMLVHAPADVGTAPEGRYLLRWESRPSNQDQPWDPPHPEPGPLEVYRLGRPAPPRSGRSPAAPRGASTGPPACTAARVRPIPATRQVRAVFGAD